MKYLAHYLTIDKENLGCYVYIYSAIWRFKTKIIHRYYTGITNNINRRWKEHYKGINSGWKAIMNKKLYKKPEIKLVFLGMIPIGIPYRNAEEYIKGLRKSQKRELESSIYNIIGWLKLK